MKVRWLLLLAAVAFPRAARADGRGAPCAERQSSALGQIACELAHNLPTPTQPMRVMVHAITSPLRMERADDLANRLARAVAGELGPNARVEPPTAGPARIDSLVIDAELTRERFSVTAELFTGVAKFWDRFRPGSRGTTARAHAAHAVDAELASYLPPVPLVLTRVDKARVDEPSVALACGDVEGDGGLAIVSVGRRRIQVGRVARGRFDVTHSKAWSELSDIAPRPLREPLASAYVDANHRVQVGISDRSEALSLDRELLPTARFRATLPWPNAGCVPFVPGGVGEARGRCDAPPPRNPGGPLDALAGARLARRDGTTFDVFAGRRTNAELSLEVGGTRFEAGTSGAQLALADLDSDGSAELISSLDTLEPSGDAVVVRTILADGKLREAFRIPVPNGVRALAACPAWGTGLAPILIATGDEVWVAR
ncbi:MAG TPA: hypothetical protein VFQ35_28740 [Polyangiaceae bacterium]|nr:hypothetical protein [Polyangiaceae bacterium]